MTEEDAFRGYKRKDGSVGTRNHVAVIATTIHSGLVAKGITTQVDGTFAYIHPYERRFGALAHKTIAGIARNPNVAATLVIGLEAKTTPNIAEEVVEAGKPVECIVMQEKGAISAIEKGIRIAVDLVIQASETQRESVPVNKLVLAVECGSTDVTNYIASNPVVGYAVDKIIAAGGTVILNEPDELLGAEEYLASRAVTDEVAKKVYEVIREHEEWARKHVKGGPGAMLDPDNTDGGISTIEEKSFGGALKSGTKPLRGVLLFAEKPPSTGLFLMNAPSFGGESLTAMAAAGANVMAFATGRGNPVGNLFVPVVKLCGNPHTIKKMGEHIDLDVSPILTGSMTIEEAGEKLYEETLKVASGKTTKAEALGHREFVITVPRPPHWP